MAIWAFSYLDDILNQYATIEWFNELCFRNRTQPPIVAVLRPLSYTNVGQATLKVSSVELEENDAVKKLSILDADDWQNVQEIEPDQSGLCDSRMAGAGYGGGCHGRLIITHNAGQPTAAHHHHGRDGHRCTNRPCRCRRRRRHSRPSRRWPVSSRCAGIQSRGVAALNVTGIDLLQAIAKRRAMPSAFILCSGLAESPANCLAPDVPATHL